MLRRLEGWARGSRTSVVPLDPRCAEPFDAQDLPLLGYDGAPSTQRHGTERIRHPGTKR